MNLTKPQSQTNFIQYVINYIILFICQSILQFNFIIIMNTTKLSTLQLSRRNNHDSPISHRLTTLSSLHSRSRIDPLFNDQMAFSVVLTQCAFHRSQKITNFCKNKDCLLPLCPKCVKIHTEQHNKMGIFGQFNTIEESYRQAQNNLNDSLGMLDDFERLLSGLKDDYQNKKNTEKASLMEAKSYYVRKIQQIFQNLEKAMDDYENEKDRQFIKTLADGQSLLTVVAEVARNSLMKLGNTQSSMQGIISYYSSLGDVMKLKTTQQNLAELFPQIITIEAQFDELEKISSSIMNYVGFGFPNNGIWAKYNSKLRQNQIKAKSKYTTIDKRTSKVIISKLQQLQTKSKEELFDYNQKDDTSKLSSALDKFKSPLDGFSLQRFRKARNSIKSAQ